MVTSLTFRDEPVVVEAENPLLRKYQEMQVALMNRAMADMGVAESIDGTTQLMNRADYRPKWGTRWLDTPQGAIFNSTLHDRKKGKNAPFIENEQDLSISQGVARALDETLAPSKAIRNSLVPYVFGTGFQFDVKVKRDRRPMMQNAQNKIMRVQEFVSRFLDENCFYGGGDGGEPLGAEMFWRCHRDGEAINLLATNNNAKNIKWRILDPRQLAEPMGETRHLVPEHDFSTNLSWGIHSADHDCQERLGYCISWDYGDWYYYQSDYVCHFKNNVDSNVARGLTDYYPIQEWLNLHPRLMRATGEGAREQASIAYVVEHAMAAAATVITLQTQQGNVEMQVPNGGGGTQSYWQGQRPPGSALHVGKNQQYKPGPLGAERGQSFIDVSQALLRLIGSRFMLSEGQISGNDANNNFASSITAGSRFWSFAKYLQGNLGHRYLAVIWKALALAYQHGQFPEFGSWEEFCYFIEIVPTAPKIESQTKAEEEQMLSQRYTNGIITKDEYRSAIGLDPDLSGAEEKSAPPLAESAMAYVMQLYDKVASGQMQPMDAVQISMSTLGLEEERAKAIFGNIKPQPQGMPGQPGMPGPGGQPGMPGDPSGAPQPQGQESGGSHAWMNQSRMQFIRNNRAITDIITGLQQGESPVLAEAKLAMLGFAPDKAKAIIADITGDGKLDDESLLMAGEDIAREGADAVENGNPKQPFPKRGAKPVGESEKDGDGDGMINDGTPEEAPAGGAAGAVPTKGKATGRKKIGQDKEQVVEFPNGSKAALHTNPTREKLRKLLTDDVALTGYYDKKNARLHVWDSSAATHAHGAELLKLNPSDPGYAATIKRVTITDEAQLDQAFDRMDAYEEAVRTKKPHQHLDMIQDWVQHSEDNPEKYKALRSEGLKFAESGEGKWKAIHDYTQSYFTANGETEIKSYRGMVLPEDHPVFKAIDAGSLNEGDEFELDKAVDFASYSKSENTALAFTIFNSKEGHRGLVIERVVPAEDVVMYSEAYRPFAPSTSTLHHEGELIAKHKGSAIRVRLAKKVLN